MSNKLNVGNPEGTYVIHGFKYKGTQEARSMKNSHSSIEVHGTKYELASGKMRNIKKFIPNKKFKNDTETIIRFYDFNEKKYIHQNASSAMIALMKLVGEDCEYFIVTKEA